MKYYILKNSTGDDIGKEYPQTDGMCLEHRSSEPNCISFLPNLEMPGFEPNLDYFVLDKKAKLTDFISTALINASGFIVSKKIKYTLEKFDIAKYKFYPARILFKNKFYDYYWLHFCEDMSPLIDLANTTFDLKTSITWNIWNIVEGNIHFKTYDHFLQKHHDKEILDQLFPQKLYFKSNGKKKHILTFKYLGTKVLISSELAQAFSNEKITGYELSDIEYPVIYK